MPREKLVNILRPIYFRFYMIITHNKYQKQMDRQLQETDMSKKLFIGTNFRHIRKDDREYERLHIKTWLWWQKWGLEH